MCVSVFLSGLQLVFFLYFVTFLTPLFLIASFSAVLTLTLSGDVVHYCNCTRVADRRRGSGDKLSVCAGNRPFWTPGCSSDPRSPPHGMDAPLALLICLLAVPAVANDGKPRSCSSVRQFYIDKGFSQNWLPRIKISGKELPVGALSSETL